MEDTFTKHKSSVHHILAQSYSVYLILLLVGVGLDYIFKLQIFAHPSAFSWGMLFIALGTLLILWAQQTSKSMPKATISRDIFYRGPYRWSRSPTHWGLMFLIAGFGVVVNAVFVVLSALVALLICKFTFLRWEEKLLADKYGEPYLQYKEKTKW